MKSPLTEGRDNITETVPMTATTRSMTVKTRSMVRAQLGLISVPMSRSSLCGGEKKLRIAFHILFLDLSSRVGELSGGERGRLHLAKLLQTGGNVLLLD